MKIERVETIFSQGTSRYREDGLFVNPPFFGVVDGLSAPHNPVKGGPLLFDEMSGGEMVRKVVLENFYLAPKDPPLRRVLIRANQQVGEIQKERGIPISRSDLLAGVSFACLKIEEKSLKVIQAADCFAVWTLRNEYHIRTIGATRSQVSYEFGLEIRGMIAQLMAKHSHNRDLIWDDFIPIISMQRYRDVNKKVPTGYALLNGQAALLRCWQEQEVPLQNLELVILFSDGFIPFAETANELEMAKKVINLYRKSGLSGVLEGTRKAESKKSKESHIAQTEATAVAIEFGG